MTDMDIPSPGVKNAVMYFNSLTRKEKHPEPLLPSNNPKRKSADIIETVEQKLYQSNSDITKNTNDNVNSIQCIKPKQYLEINKEPQNFVKNPEKLIAKSEDVVTVKSQYNKPLVKKRDKLRKGIRHNKPDLIIPSDFNEMQQNWDVRRDDSVESTNSMAVDGFCGTLMNRKTHETPDQEAKKILEEFKKEISPYNTFIVSKDVIDSDGDLIKQTLELFPEVRRSLRNSSGSDKTRKTGKRNGVVIEDEG